MIQKLLPSSLFCHQHQTDWAANIIVAKFERLQRCWWRMLETECVDAKNKMFIRFLSFLSPTTTSIKKCHQRRNSVTNIHKLSPNSGHQHHCHRLSNSGEKRVTISPISPSLMWAAFSCASLSMEDYQFHMNYPRTAMVRASLVFQSESRILSWFDGSSVLRVWALLN